ncbi:MAG: iron ABC transporter permease [Desulfovibrionaceae bacterium]|nr:iron ABC transporter permease [Desulfovibrionaceae bacterium]
MAAAPPLAALLSMSIGSADLSLAEVVGAVFNPVGLAADIIWDLRLPRTLMALLAGFGLALSGTVSQSILRNPLASPFTLGVASGAGFGAVLAIVCLGGRSEWLIAALAFAFALLCSLLVLAVARIRRASAETLILSGVALMYLFSALTSLMQYISPLEEVQQTVFWFFGNLSKAGWPEIGLAGLMILVPFPLLMCASWDLNLLMHGDEEAASMGVNVQRLRGVGVVLSALMAAGAICFTGVIGFVGLVAPHMARMLIGSDHRFLLPASGLLGAALVAGADVLARTVWPPQVVPIGIMTSFLGVPFFFYLLAKKARRLW